MQYFLYDEVGDRRLRDFWQAIHSAAHAFGLKAKFVECLYQAKDISSSLVGRSKLAYARNWKVEVIMRSNGSDAGCAAVCNVVLFYVD